jgi:protein arginine kinase
VSPLDGATRSVIDRLAGQAPEWAREQGPRSDAILSSRVRFARNLASLPFPPRASREQDRQVITRLRRAAQSVNELRSAEYLDLEGLAGLELDVLIERRLASRDLAQGNRKRGVLVASGERITVMVNEEDHFRLTGILSGLRLGEALDLVNEVDRGLGQALEFAFDAELGFLTACPTNVGTGMRASVLAHLPALVLTRRAKKVIQGVAALGLSVRGYYGEGTEIMGNFFQISNQNTLGKGENEIVSRLDEVVRQILDFESSARDSMWSGARVQLEDKIYRAFATLRSARTIAADEVVSLASAVRFGIALELPDLCPLRVLNEVLVISQPGHVSRLAGRALGEEDRRQFRAELIRKRLSQNGGEPPVPRPGIGTEGPVTGREG